MVEIADNGRGFDVAAARARPGHFGLSNLEHRATHLGARLGIESDAGGTRIRLEIPISAATS